MLIIYSNLSFSMDFGSVILLYNIIIKEAAVKFILVWNPSSYYEKCCFR